MLALHTPSHAARCVSCGLVIECPEGWLMVRTTKRERWDFPKGGLEPGETPMMAALRECREETGLDWTSRQGELEDLGRHSYLPHKDLHLFRLRLPAAIPLDKCHCSTLAYYGEDGPYPETDAWAWMHPDEAKRRVGKGLRSLIERINLAWAHGV